MFAMAVSGTGGDLKVAMTAALDAYLASERQRADETTEINLEIKKLRDKLHDSYTSTHQRLGEEIGQLTVDFDKLKDEVAKIREDLAGDASRLAQGTSKLALELEAESSKRNEEVKRLTEELKQVRAEVTDDNIKLRGEVVSAARDAYHATEQRRAEEVANLRAAMEGLRAELREEDIRLRSDVSEAMAQLTAHAAKIQEDLRAEFQTLAANDRFAANMELERIRGDVEQVGPLKLMVAQTQDSVSRMGAHEVMATLRVDNLFAHGLQPLDFEFPLVASRCMIRLKPVKKVESGSPFSPRGSRSSSPSRRDVVYEPGLEYVGMFFGLCETRVALGNAANRLSSYVCSVRVDIYDSNSSAWLTALENQPQELSAGGALFGSNEVFTVQRFKELVNSSLSPDRKLIVRVVVSDIGLLRLAQLDDTQALSSSAFH
eukprot:TRINITY_DN35307_c0_g1_i1.p1 TRINITY_DN35307_c0_g1~~TRINITY_DN35307_c0_g1_i1.p1  ORF type:complete len:432 (+),score=89.62 TRINITY_DN35307_c0_g1_i1:172-1467(+)